MPKDKRISELPGISSAVSVALNRMGLLTASDLVNADFEQVAVVIEDFNEATRLVREARQVADPRKVKEGPSGSTPAPLASGTMNTAPRTAIRIAGASKPAATSKVAAPVQAALALAPEKESPDWRERLARRFAAASVLLEHEGSQVEVAACLALDAAESGELARSGAKLGPEVEGLLEECLSIRTVPVLPSGKPPRYYLEMASKSSAQSRRVCAAALIASIRLGEAHERAGLQIEALSAGESEPIIEELLSLARSARLAA